MRADREQVRRDVDDPFSDDVLQRLVASNREYQNAHGHYIVPLAVRLLDARRKLEQAERERDEWKRQAQANLASRDEWSIRALAAEAQLAKVPALVEALREWCESFPDEVGDQDRGALSEWEQAQGETP